MNFFARNYPSILIFWVALILVLLHRPVRAVDFTHCSLCHPVVLEEMLRPHQHVPFLQQRCGECHLPKSLPVGAAKEDSAIVKARRKISWLGESLMADGRHGFVLPGEKVRNTLVVEVRGLDGALSRQSVPVPPLAGLQEAKDLYGVAPVISELQVLRVERGVFLSAAIGWQTDTLADALVRYGTREQNQTAQSGNRFGRRHEVVLSNLKPDQTYQFSVVARDFFGRSRTSETMTFSTAKPLTTSPPSRTVSPPESGEVDGLTSHFQRVGGNYLLELALGQPGSVFVGTDEVPPRPNSLAGSAGPTGGNDRNHSALSSKKATALEACGGCHRKKARSTHPVNVLPKPGMTIPPEYPTLPDGRITCRSCHETHSSNFEYLTIKRNGRTLCVGCHKDML